MIEAWAERVGKPRQGADTLAARVEIAGETAFCYATDEAPLLATLKTEPSLIYLHRPANLEDVFLKLTGRDLRD